MRNLSQFEALVRCATARAEVGGADTAYPGVWFAEESTPSGTPCAAAPGPSVAVLLRGTKRVQVGERSLSCAAGQYVVLTREGACESNVLATPCLWVSFEMPPEMIVDIMMALGDEHGGAGLDPNDELAYVADADEGLLEPLARFVGHLSEPSECRVLAPLVHRELVFRLLTSQAAAAFRRAARAHSEGSRIRDAMRYMRARFASQLTVEQVARQVAMCPTQFADCFHDVARVTPMRYLKRLRMQQARDALLDGAATAEAAARVGYASTSHFTRDFKSFYGAAPGSYARARVRSAHEQQGPEGAAQR